MWELGMMLSIGDVAEAAGVGVQAIRFYEREGLIAQPTRTKAGYRQYEASAIDQLRFIRRAQELGFTLKEIRELIALETVDGADCNDVCGAATAKVDAIQKKIDDLKRIRTELEALIHSCTGSVPVRQCKIIECLHTA
jgi:MerR family transcriptional regulator, copper efflux regulator